MSTAFDLEQKIMNCWNVCDDIKAMLEVADRRPMTEDEQQNYLLGLATIYQVKFEALFESFEQYLKETAQKKLVF